VAITAVNFKRENRQVSFVNGVFTVTEPVEVFTDLALSPGATVTSDPLFFVGDPLFPTIGDVHPENSNIRFHNIGNGTPTNEKKSVWRFPLIYKSNQPSTTEQSGDSNQRDDEYVNSTIAKKSWSFKSVQIPRRRTPVSDDDGTTFTTADHPICTTAGEPLIASESQYTPTCTYNRNELVVPASIMSLVGSVNTDAITIDGIPVTARQALISDVRITPWKTDKGVSFRTVTYTIMLKEDTWDLRVLNRGIYQKEVNQNKTIIEQAPANGRKPIPITKPVLLEFFPSGTTDDFQNSATLPLDLNGSLDEIGSKTHFRRYLHPQLTAFSAYGFN